MATNIDKALYQAPSSMEEDALDEEPIEIEIVDPEEVTIGMGDMELTIRPEDEDHQDFSANLAEKS